MQDQGRRASICRALVQQLRTQSALQYYKQISIRQKPIVLKGNSDNSNFIISLRFYLFLLDWFRYKSLHLPCSFLSLALNHKNKSLIVINYHIISMYKRFKVCDVVSNEQAAVLVEKYGSPLYVYRQAIIREKVRRLKEQAGEFKVCYAIKANTNTKLVQLIRKLGIDYVDAVSPGEVHRALACGFPANHIMYTENFIAPKELEYAIKTGVTLNIGALQTLERYREELKGQSIFLRINPKVGAGTSHHVVTGGPKSKFGIYEDDLLKVREVAKESGIRIVGLHQHIGSNMKRADAPVLLQTMRYAFELLHLFEDVREINIGGGLGVAYRDDEKVSEPCELFTKVREFRDEFEKKLGREIGISVEPGRYIVADSSVLLCTVTASKKTPEKHFLGTDTGFNHLIRPALYGAYHQIENLTHPDAPKQLTAVCGNICESTDFLGQDRQLGGEIGDILAIENVGAYGFSMSSNYNERPRPAQVLINLKEEVSIIRRRETLEDLADKL